MGRQGRSTRSLHQAQEQTKQSSTVPDTKQLNDDYVKTASGCRQLLCCQQEQRQRLAM
jgi:hypothetical protein